MLQVNIESAQRDRRKTDLILDGRLRFRGGASSVLGDWSYNLGLTMQRLKNQRCRISIKGDGSQIKGVGFQIRGAGSQIRGAGSQSEVADFRSGEIRVLLFCVAHW